MQFNNDVNNLVLAELLSSPDFDDYVGDLTIVRHFVPWSVSPAYSNFGFDLGTGAGHCSIAWNDATTTDLVEGAVAASAPIPNDHRRKVHLPLRLRIRLVVRCLVECVRQSDDHTRRRAHAR